MQRDPLQQSYLEARGLFNAKRYAESLAACRDGLALTAEGEYRVYLLLSKAMTEYALGEISALETTVQSMEHLAMPEVIRCRWLMLRGRVLAHRRDPMALACFAESEAAFAELGLAQDQAWAQLSAARLALTLGDNAAVWTIAARVAFRDYQVKARLLEAEAHLAVGDTHAAGMIAKDCAAGNAGACDEVDIARTLYVQAACALARNELVEAGLLLGEARNRAVVASQKDFELLNAIEALRARLEMQGG